MTPMVWSGFGSYPGHVVASLDMALYNGYICLVAWNKQQIYVERSQPENLENGQLLSVWGFVKNRRANVAPSRVENKYESIKVVFA